MKRMKKAAAVFLAATLLFLAACTVPAEMLPAAQQPRPAAAAAVDPAAIRPQDDFYGYVNAAWLLENLPAYGENGSGTFAAVEKQTQEELLALLKEISTAGEAYPPGSTEQLIRDMFAQGMAFDDGASVLAELRDTAAEIREAADIRALLLMWRDLARDYGLRFPAAAIARADIFSGGQNALYIRQLASLGGFELEEMKEDDGPCLRAKSDLTDLLLPFTADKEEAERLAAEAVYLLLDIAFGTDFSVQHAANPFTTYTFAAEAEVALLLPNLGMSPLAMAFGLEENPYGGYYVQDPGQLETINGLLTAEHLEAWQTVLIALLVRENLNFIAGEAPSLAADSSLRQPKEELVAEDILSALYQPIGKLYAERYYTTEMDEALTAMCGQLQESYRHLIDGADWLTRAGRDSLLKKLDAISFILGGGGPRITDPADAALIGKDYPETLRNMRARQQDAQIALIGAPADLTEPSMAAFEVNACYDPANTVTITAAIMHAPVFDLQASEAANLGGLGMVVAHEIGHAFDSICMDYNELGRYDPEWLCEADRAQLAVRSLRLAEYYGAYTVLDVYHVDGVKTCGENYADLGAMECITGLVDSEEELKALFESFARIWAANILDTDAVEQLRRDEHSPARIRVNAVLSSCEKFYAVYGVREGDGMYRAPGERVSRW